MRVETTTEPAGAQTQFLPRPGAALADVGAETQATRSAARARRFRIPVIIPSLIAEPSSCQVPGVRKHLAQPRVVPPDAPGGRKEVQQNEPEDYAHQNGRHPRAQQVADENIPAAWRYPCGELRAAARGL